MEVFEFRGVSDLVYAEVLTDDNDEESGYTTGTVKPLSPVAEIGKTTETSSEAKYYDNIPLIVINSEGVDEIKIICAPPNLETLSDITGKYYDATKGAMIGAPREVKYFAIGYKTKGTDGKERYVWRFKGTFSIPDETSKTEDDGTDSENTELTFTGIYTTHKFTVDSKKKPVKDLVVDERYDKADLSTYFTTVTTPETLKAKEGV